MWKIHSECAEMCHTVKRIAETLRACEWRQLNSIPDFERVSVMFDAYNRRIAITSRPFLVIWLSFCDLSLFSCVFFHLLPFSFSFSCNFVCFRSILSSAIFKFCFTITWKFLSISWEQNDSKQCDQLKSHAFLSLTFFFEKPNARFGTKTFNFNE